MNKLIIQNNTGLSDEKILEYVLGVIRLGRISNNDTQYCYHTSFEDGIEITSYLNKKSDRFVIYQSKIKTALKTLPEYQNK